MKNEDDFVCTVCQRKNAVMKRCTRCHKTIYCSRECQKADWTSHKKFCVTTSSSIPLKNSELSSENKEHRHYIDDGSIFGEGKDLKEEATYPIHPPLIDFNKGKKTVNKENNSSLIGKEVRKNGSESNHSYYLYYNEMCYDVPDVDKSQPYSNIIVKSNREKHSIDIQRTWTGQNVFKVLACKLKIPLDTLKIINKGKVMTPDIIQSCIEDKALFQAIGEQAANEDGVDKRDIELMMKHLKISRNEAVLSLKRKGDVIDAILEIGNK